MTKRRLIRLLSAGVGLALLAGAWAFFAPGKLGGSTSYAVTYGTSMEPKLRRGDLAIIHPASSYHVGEIVAYKSHDLHRTVLHRIVAERSGRYTFKGDNNSFLDPERPTRDQLEGRLWLRVPKAGALLGWLSTPRNSALLTGGLALLAAAGAGTRARRRRGPGRESRQRNAPASPSAERWQGILVALGVVAAGSALLGAVAFTRSPTGTVPTDHLYQQLGSFTYAGVAPSGAVYGVPAVHTGDAVFVRLVPSVRMRFAYAFDALEPHAVTGKAQLQASISDGSGWQRMFQLASPVAFTGDKVSVGGTLDVGRLHRLVARFEAATGAHSDAYHVTVVPSVRVSGIVAGQQIHDAFAPALAFDLDPYRLALASSASGTAPANALKPTKPGSGHLIQARTVAILGLKLGIGTARRIAPLGLALSLLGLALAGLRLWRRVHGDEPSRIQALYGSLLVPVTGVTRVRARTAVGVATIEALVGIAKRYETVVLHEERDDAHAYVVEAGGMLCRYTIGEFPDEPAPPRLAAVHADFDELDEPAHASA